MALDSPSFSIINSLCLQLDSFHILLLSHRRLEIQRPFFNLCYFCLSVQDGIASANIILLKILWVFMNLIRVSFLRQNPQRVFEADPSLSWTLSKTAKGNILKSLEALLFKR